MLNQSRADVSQKIEGHLAEIKKEIEAVEGDQDLEYDCFGPFDKLKHEINQIESIAHLSQMEQQAEKAFDSAIEKIEKFSNRKKEPKPGGSDPPKLKPRCVIKPAEFAGKSYLEDIADINNFIDQLRQRLEEAIKSGQRILIR